MTMKHFFHKLPHTSFVLLNRWMGVCFIVIFFSSSLKSQSVFWTETFSNGCSSGCNVSGYTGPNGAWTVTNVSAPGTKANMWFVSCAENGNNAGDCGSGCSSSDASLHIGSQAIFLFCPTGDCGAAYNATNSNHITNKRAASPLINCSGKTGITVSFNYIGKGQTCTTDYCDLQYSSDGGTTWSNLQTCLTATTCPSGQGRWTAFSIALPAACDNNANVKIGFRWANNGDGAGSDPSFAVDDITLSETITLPIELLIFKGKMFEKENLIEWATATETHNDHFTLERSENGVDFESIGSIPGAGNSFQKLDYSYSDKQPPAGVSYYRLKQTDYDGNYSYSGVISLKRDRLGLEIINLYSSTELDEIEATINSFCQCRISAELYDMQGRSVFKAIISPDDNITTLRIPSGNLPQGIYLFTASDGTHIVNRKIKR